MPKKIASLLGDGGVMKAKTGWITFAALMIAFAIVLSVSAIATVGGGDSAIDAGSQVQNEISLTLLPGTVPGQPQVLVAAYNDVPVPGGPGLGVAYSTNGGANWNPQNLSYPTHSLGYTMVEAWDPATAADTQGNLYVAHISTDGNWSGGPATGLYVRKSADGGVNWQTPVAVSENGPPSGSPDPIYRLNDRDQMTADTFSGSPNADNIYISWIKDRGWNAGPYGDIYFAYSTNGAASFNLATGLTQTWPDGTSTAFPGRINDASPVDHNMGNMPVPAAAPDGTVYVSWMDYNVFANGGPTGIIYLDKSTDGGATWGQDIFVTSVNIPPRNLPNDNTRAKGAPVLGVSPTNPSELYLVYAENPDLTLLADGTYLDGPDNGDILFIKSTDGGNTWTSPLTVNDDFITGLKGTNDQILPWMDVKPTGTIDIAWYDRRNDLANLKWDVYVTKSVDGGASFSTNQNINDANFASPVLGTEGWLGEYLGLAVDGNYMYIAWTTSVNDSAGDVYFDKSDNSALCNSGKPSLSLSSATPFWGSYNDYLASLLSVNYTIQNNGASTANNVAISNSTATNGVVCSTNMPVSIGTIAASGSATTTLKYSIPPGVSRFRATVNAAADDACGNSYTYP
jgi:hypothetical protein